MLAAVSVGQKLTQTGLVFFFLEALLVLIALHWRRRPQHRAGRSLYNACGANALELFLFRHGSI